MSKNDVRLEVGGQEHIINWSELDGYFVFTCAALPNVIVSNKDFEAGLEDVKSEIEMVNDMAQPEAPKTPRKEKPMEIPEPQVKNVDNKKLMYLGLGILALIALGALLA